MICFWRCKIMQLFIPNSRVALLDLGCFNIMSLLYYYLLAQTSCFALQSDAQMHPVNDSETCLYLFNNWVERNLRYFWQRISSKLQSMQKSTLCSQINNWTLISFLTYFLCRLFGANVILTENVYLRVKSYFDMYLLFTRIILIFHLWKL